MDSLPNAPHTLYLDFNGHAQTWNATDNAAVGSFDHTSLIRDIWRTVAEDFAPFNINVTTRSPSGAFQRIAIGPEVDDWYQRAASGVAIAGDNTAWVFTDRIADLAVPIANVISHEAGHVYGLDHQSDANSREYSEGGHDWTPIMGNPHDSDRHRWTEGFYWNEETGETRYQHDVDVLFRRLGARPDDHAPSAANATSMTRSGANLTASGVIGLSADGQANDQDWFRFDTTGGAVELTAIVGSRDVGYASNAANFDAQQKSVANANLDVRLTLYNDRNQTVATVEPRDSLGATLALSLPAGRYYLAVESARQSVGDLGLYTVFGSAPWAKPVAPSGFTVQARSGTQVDLAWNDSPNEQTYRLWRRDGSRETQVVALAADSTRYSLGNLTPGQTVQFRIEAMNAAGSAFSSWKSVTLPQSSPPAAPASFTVMRVNSSMARLSWRDVSNETSYKVYRWNAATNQAALVVTLAANSTSWTVRGLRSGSTEWFYVEALNAAGSAASEWKSIRL